MVSAVASGGEVIKLFAAEAGYQNKRHRNKHQPYHGNVEKPPVLNVPGGIGGIGISS